jgi:hypothetical protein
MLTVANLLSYLNDGSLEDPICVGTRHVWGVCWSSKVNAYLLMLREARGLTRRQLQRRLGHAKREALVFFSQERNGTRPLFASALRVGETIDSIPVEDRCPELACA